MEYPAGEPTKHGIAGVARAYHSWPRCPCGLFTKARLWSADRQLILACLLVLNSSLETYSWQRELLSICPSPQPQREIHNRLSFRRCPGDSPSSKHQYLITPCEETLAKRSVAATNEAFKTSNMPEKNYNSLRANWKCALACILVSLCPFQYGLDFGLIQGIQAMVGFMRVFGYREPLSPTVSTKNLERSED